MKKIYLGLFIALLLIGIISATPSLTKASYPNLKHVEYSELRCNNIICRFDLKITTKDLVNEYSYDKDGNEITTQINKATVSRLTIPNIADEKKLESERDRIIKINLERYRPKQIQQESFITKLRREIIDFLI